MTRHFKIFLSSPSDVNQERKLAQDVIDNLLYDAEFKDKVELEIVAWDRPGNSVPLLATATPQAAIDAGLDQPKVCDIVVVIFWSRMGTPLPHPDYQKADGSPYWSGTEWEFTNALEGFQANKCPEILLYQRTSSIALSPYDDDYDQKSEQLQRVSRFFRALRDPKTGAYLRGYNQYKEPEDFRREFDGHLRNILKRLLREKVGEEHKTKHAITLKKWEQSPFPGLEAFTEEQQPIFFGRGHEIDKLVAKISATRFVAVSGPSGSGKSSVVAAGLIPRLRDYAIVDENQKTSANWLIVSAKPNTDPFLSLANAIKKSVIAQHPEAESLLDEKFLYDDLKKGDFSPIFDILQTIHPWEEIFIFIDQFEEVFTIVFPELRDLFIQLISQTFAYWRIVITIRSDFLPKAMENPTLVPKLSDGAFILPLPDYFALLEMIEQPAKRAGLEFEPELAKTIVRETGNEPGALALMAYALDELYRVGKSKQLLTFEDYKDLGGVKKAIGKRAQLTFDNLSPSAKEAVPTVFRELLDVDERGTATRQRAPMSKFRQNQPALELINAFIDARLLVTSQIADTHQEALVEVAHEALLREWELLAQWIENTQEDLRLEKRVRNAAREWHEDKRNPIRLWQHELLQPVYEMQLRQNIQFDDITQAFIRPEAERRLDEFMNIFRSASTAAMAWQLMPIVARWGAIGESATKQLLEARGSGLPNSVVNAIDKILTHQKNVSSVLIALLLETTEPPHRYLERIWGKRDLPKNFYEVLFQKIMNADGKDLAQYEPVLKALPKKYKILEKIKAHLYAISASESTWNASTDLIQLYNKCVYNSDRLIDRASVQALEQKIKAEEAKRQTEVAEAKRQAEVAEAKRKAEEAKRQAEVAEAQRKAQAKAQDIKVFYAKEAQARAQATVDRILNPRKIESPSSIPPQPNPTTYNATEIVGEHGDIQLPDWLQEPVDSALHAQANTLELINGTEAELKLLFEQNFDDEELVAICQNISMDTFVGHLYATQEPVKAIAKRAIRLLMKQGKRADGFVNHLIASLVSSDDTREQQTILATLYEIGGDEAQRFIAMWGNQ
jgi:energy-coupling factor transporter ATP-binding protein EcfA2